MTDNEEINAPVAQRLCSEIQLFDLCELDSCRYKNGRFCSDPVLLGKFERITEVEVKAPERYISEELDDDFDDDSYDEEDDFEREDFDDGEYDERDDD